MMQKPSYEELEKQLAEQQKALQQQARFERINRALYKVSNTVSRTSALDELFASIRSALSAIIDTTNFFIALYDPVRDCITFPFCIDTVDSSYPTALDVSLSESLTAEIIRTGRPLLITAEEEIRRRSVSNRIIPPCTIAKIWLGVPLQTAGKLIGVMAVQSYTDPELYDQTDVEMMASVAEQVAVAIQRKRWEQDLSESAAHLQSVFRSAPIGIGVNINRVLQQVNQRLCEMTGYSREELIGQDARLLYLDQQSYEYVGREKYRQIRERHTGTVETIWRRKDGTVIDVLLGSTALDSADLSKGVTFTALDITRRIEMENELRESERKFALAFDASPDSVNINRLEDGLYVEINKGFERLTGFTRDDVMGKTSLDIDIWHDPADRLRLVQSLKEKGYCENLETRFRRKDGSVATALMSARVISLHGVPHIISITRDISERKQAEAERERLMVAIEQTKDIVVITDPEGTIQYANPAFQKITGYSRAESLGQNMRILKSGKQDSAFYQDLWQTISSGMAWNGHIVNRRQNGTLYTEDATISPVCDSAGKITNYVAVKRDITEEIRLASQLQQAQKMESVGRLTGGVAHDFNNILGVIIGYTDMALEHVDPKEPLYDDLQKILEAANRSADIVRQLLAFARKQTASPRLLNLNDTVEGILKMMHHLIGEDIDLVWLPEKDLWLIKMDPAQIDQILANLCVNARDAITDVGRIIIETGMEVLDEEYCAEHVGFVPGEYVVLAVRDDGNGMDKETLEHIFEPFFTTKEVGQGTGLGLATVYGIVKQNNGFINATSELGKGSKFTIYLPRCREENDQKSSTHPVGRRQSRGETVLLVEDEPTILKLGQKMLERMGYRVLAAVSPSEAFRLAEEYDGELDLLITDVIMPEMNGWDLAERLFSLYPDLKSLFMSGYPAEIIAQHNVLAEGIFFIQKPFSARDLAIKVREVLENS
ncbi:MAG: PAS domain S-box protein [Desulfoprunum sp.]|nr:PAS domain S-box protein [Desulfoprunum sp.]